MAVLRVTPYTTQPTPVPPPVPVSQSSMWDVLKNLVVAMGIYLFYSGWVYLYFFLKEFGLSIHNVSIELASYYVYGYAVFSDTINFLILFANATLIVGIYYFRNNLQSTYVALLVATLILIFPELFYLARSKALENAHKTFTGHVKTVPIYLNFKKELYNSLERTSVDSINPIFANDIQDSELLLDKNDRGELFLFFETECEYFVFANPNEPNQFTKSIEIFRISKEDINYSKIFSEITKTY